jgi:long-chain fatty acid transport protein
MNACGSRPFRLGKSAALPLLATLPCIASASSFQILEQSPAHLGKAFAGTASDISDATTVFFNPAAMTELEGRAAAFGLNAILVQSEFTDTGSNTGGVPGETDEPELVPNFYYVQPLSPRLALGIGLNAPFGLSSSYDDEWVGRYLATESELEVINFGINLAYMLTEQLSVGGGINYQRLDVTLENQVDSTLGVAPNPATDSSATVRGDDDAFVFDLSLYYQPIEPVSIGLLWRQGADFSLSGDAQFVPAEICTTGAGFPTGAPPAPTTGTLCAASLAMRAGEVTADVELPDTLTLSGSYAVTNQWSLHADAAWTRWDSIDSVEIINVENDVVVDTLELQYSNTMRYALGTSYAMSEVWTWRAGIAWDEAPQTDPNFVTPRIPDQDRTWLSAGFNYMLSENLSLDVGYAHLFVDDTRISDINPLTGHRVEGEFESSVDIVGVQANWTF